MLVLADWFAGRGCGSEEHLGSLGQKMGFWAKEASGQEGWTPIFLTKLNWILVVISDVPLV